MKARNDLKVTVNSYKPFSAWDDLKFVFGFLFLLAAPFLLVALLLYVLLQ